MLPDGREVPTYLTCGPEVLNNPHLLAQIAATYPVKAYWPRRGGYGNNYSGGYDGYRGRRY
jgi:hypothetical protein